MERVGDWVRLGDVQSGMGIREHDDGRPGDLDWGWWLR